LEKVSKTLWRTVENQRQHSLTQSRKTFAWVDVLHPKNEKIFDNAVNQRLILIQLPVLRKTSDVEISRVS